MRVVYSNIDCKTAISKSSLPGLDYSLNPYFGCEHRCKYCYSPSVFRGSIAPSSWGSFVKIKKNILEVLRNDLKKKTQGVIGLSTVTDPYQPIEKQSKLTRDCIKLISESKFKLSIQTKSNLFLRDIGLMERNKTDIGITVTTLDNNLARILEPNASTPYERMGAIAKATSKGFNSWIFLGPIIPRVNDDIDGMDEILQFARKNGIKIMYDKLNLRPGVMETLSPVLEELKNGLTKIVIKELQRTSVYWSKLSKEIEDRCSSLELECKSAF